MIVMLSCNLPIPSLRGLPKHCRLSRLGLFLPAPPDEEHDAGQTQQNQGVGFGNSGGRYVKLKLVLRFCVSGAPVYAVAGLVVSTPTPPTSGSGSGCILITPGIGTARNRCSRSNHNEIITRGRQRQSGSGIGVKAGGCRIRRTGQGGNATVRSKRTIVRLRCVKLDCEAAGIARGGSHGQLNGIQNIPAGIASRKNLRRQPRVASHRRTACRRLV